MLAANNPAIGEIPLATSSAKCTLPGLYVWPGYHSAVFDHDRGGSAYGVVFFLEFAASSVYARSRQALAKGGNTSTNVDIIEVRGGRGKGEW